jgi:soluble lytic murein transglycosylase-like protein
MGYLSAFSAAARKTGLDRSLLLAVASRESRIGEALSPSGLGDGGNGIGIMQIDRRWHPQFAAVTDALDSWANVQKGAELLNTELNRYGGNLRFALDAYNAGAGNVDKALNRGLDPDSYTTGGNYGRDVISRYRLLQQISGPAPGHIYSNGSSNNSINGSLDAVKETFRQLKSGFGDYWPYFLGGVGLMGVAGAAYELKMKN